MWPKHVHYWSAVSHYCCLCQYEQWLIVIAVLASVDWLEHKVTRIIQECQKEGTVP